MKERFEQQKEVNKNLVAELDDLNRELDRLAKDRDSLQMSYDQLNDQLHHERAQFQDQINYGEQVNAELQKQVEQVTKLTEELQEQIAENHNTSEMGDTLERKLRHNSTNSTK